MHFNHNPSRLPHNFRDESPLSDEDVSDDDWESGDDRRDDESVTTGIFVEMDYLRSQISDLRDQLKRAKPNISRYSRRWPPQRRLKSYKQLLERPKVPQE